MNVLFIFKVNLFYISRIIYLQIFEPSHNQNNFLNNNFSFNTDFLYTHMHMKQLLKLCVYWNFNYASIVIKK